MQIRGAQKMFQVAPGRCPRVAWLSFTFRADELSSPQTATCANFTSVNGGLELGQVKSRRAHDRTESEIGDGGAHLRNLAVLACGVDPIGQQDHEKLLIRINPERRPGKARVTKTSWTKPQSGGGVSVRALRVPSQRAGTHVRVHYAGEKLYSFRVDELVAPDSPLIDEHVGELSQILGRRE